jgi:hypothetical protein
VKLNLGSGRYLFLKWGSRPLPEFMGEPDPINGGYGRYPRVSASNPRPLKRRTTTVPL